MSFSPPSYCLSCGSPLAGVHWSFCITNQQQPGHLTLGAHPVTSEYRNQVPQQETRGGDHPDWKNAVAGEPLPELPEAEYPEPDSERVPGPPLQADGDGCEQWTPERYVGWHRKPSGDDPGQAFPEIS